MEVDSVEVVEHVHVHETVVEHVHVHETVTESHTFEVEVTQVNGHDDKPESESEDGEAESSLQRSDSEDSLYASTTGMYEIMPESEASAVPCGKSSVIKPRLLFLIPTKVFISKKSFRQTYWGTSGSRS